MSRARKTQCLDGQLDLFDAPLPSPVSLALQVAAFHGFGLSARNLEPRLGVSTVEVALKAIRALRSPVAADREKKIAMASFPGWGGLLAAMQRERHLFGGRGDNARAGGGADGRRMDSR